MSHRELLGFLRPFRARITLLMVLIAVQSAIAVAPALVGQRIVDDGVVRRDEGLIWAMCGVLVALGVAQAVVGVVERTFATRLAEDVALRLRTALFGHLQRQSLGFFSAARTGAIVSRLHGDVTGVQRLVSTTLPSAVGAVVLLLTAGGTVAVLEWRLALVVLLLIPVLYLLTSYFTAALRDVSRKQLASVADLDSMVAERLSPGGAEVIRHYGDPDRDLPAFRERAVRIRDVSVRNAGLAALLSGSLGLVLSLVTATIYLVAGRLVISGALSLGTMIALTALLARLYGPLTALPGVRVDLVAGLVAFDRVREVLDFAPRIVSAPDARGLPARAGRPPTVEFRDVHFTYPPAHGLVVPSLAGERPAAAGPSAPLRPVVDGLSFTAAPGTTVGIVGLSGAGKSTLARLLTRSWDVDSGQILVDGVDVRSLRLEELRAAVGVVPQETFLFHDTIRANLLLARPEADPEELVAACRDARIWSTIERLPDGLDTVIGDRGQRLSGGERQRLALARLLLKRPPIVVLDEATSHADTVTESQLHESMGEFLRTRTCLVIAHRLSTVRDADLILVMRDGRIAEQGRHQDLVAAGGWYSRLQQGQHNVTAGRS